MQKKLFKTQQILFYLFALVSLATLVMALAFMTDFKTLWEQPAGIGTFHEEVLQTYNRALFSASLVSIVGAAIIAFFDFRKAVSDYLGLGVLSILTIFNVVKSISFISQLPAIQEEYLTIDVTKLLLAVGDEYVLVTRTFTSTRIIYLIMIVVSIAFLAVSIANTMIYYKKRNEDVNHG